MKKAIIIILINLLLSACGSEQDKSHDVVSNETFPDQESWDASMVITREGKTVGLLKAGHIKKYSKQNITLLSENIQVDFYNSDGQHTSVLTSEGGKMFDVKQDMIAYDNVVVVSDSGITLYTDTLIWDNKNQKVISEIPVKITTKENDTFYGDSFISDANLENYELTNPRGKTSKTINVD